MLTIDGAVAGTVVALSDWEIPVEKVAAEIAKFASDKPTYRAALERVPSVARRYRLDQVAGKYISIFNAGN
jgi:hypothetical protein